MSIKQLKKYLANQEISQSVPLVEESDWNEKIEKLEQQLEALQKAVETHAKAISKLLSDSK